MRSDRFKHPGVSNFNVSAGSPKTKLCPSIAGNPHHSLFVLGLPGYIYIYSTKDRVNPWFVHSFASKAGQCLCEVGKACHSRVASALGQFSTTCGIGVPQQVGCWWWPSFIPLLKLRPGVVCRCLVVQIVIFLSHEVSFIPPETDSSPLKIGLPQC